MDGLIFPNAVAFTDLCPDQWLIVASIFGNFYAVPEKLRNAKAVDYFDFNLGEFDPAFIEGAFLNFILDPNFKNNST